VLLALSAAWAGPIPFPDVTLDEALADPVYALPDAATTHQGWSWLHRIEPVSEDPGALWDRAAYEGIRKRWNGD